MLLHIYRSVMDEREATRDKGKIIKIWKDQKNILVPSNSLTLKM